MKLFVIADGTHPPVDLLLELFAADHTLLLSDQDAHAAVAVLPLMDPDQLAAALVFAATTRPLFVVRRPHAVVVDTLLDSTLALVQYDEPGFRTLIGALADYETNHPSALCGRCGATVRGPYALRRECESCRDKYTTEVA